MRGFKLQQSSLLLVLVFSVGLLTLRKIQNTTSLYLEHFKYLFKEILFFYTKLRINILLY